MLIEIDKSVVFGHEYNKVITCIRPEYTFVVEIALRLIGNGFKFFKSGWNIFDFIVIGGTMFAFDPTFSAFRTLRILRLTEIMSLSKSMRIIVNAMAAIIPGMFHMFIIIGLIFYIFALVGHDMFALSNPDLFGSLGKSMLTLLLILLGDGISDTMQATMQTYEFSYLFFIVYIAMMSFTLLNLLFGIIVDAVQSAAEKEVDISDDDDDCGAQAQKLMESINLIGKRLDRIEERLNKQ